MNQRAQPFRTTVTCLALLLLGGCLASPKRHAWQISRTDVPAVQSAESWPQLATTQYSRVPETARTSAVALLRDSAFIRLEPAQLSTFAPRLHLTSGQELQPYLVRGVSYSPHPSRIVVRLDATGAHLFIQQVTYDGEMLTPFRWVAKPNAFVVLLPRAPDQVYSDAVLGGDWIFRNQRGVALDAR